MTFSSTSKKKTLHYWKNVIQIRGVWLKPSHMASQQQAGWDRQGGEGVWMRWQSRWGGQRESEVEPRGNGRVGLLHPGEGGGAPRQDVRAVVVQAAVRHRTTPRWVGLLVVQGRPPTPNPGEGRPGDSHLAEVSCLHQGLADEEAAFE